MVRDDQLTWREFELGQSRFTKEIIRANWPKPHVDAITHFFYLICNHSLREQPQGDLTLQTYADRTRYKWHLTLGTPQSFNIARINEGLLAKIGDELFNKRREQAISRCAVSRLFPSRPMLMSSTLPFSFRNPPPPLCHHSTFPLCIDPTEPPFSIDPTAFWPASYPTAFLARH
jgi:hypothetical protein